MALHSQHRIQPYDESLESYGRRERATKFEGDREWAGTLCALKLDVEGISMSTILLGTIIVLGAPALKDPPKKDTGIVGEWEVQSSATALKGGAGPHWT